MPAPKTRVRPVRIHLPDRELATTRLRGVGFRASCSCGWRSRTLNGYADARAESKAHTLTHHAETRLSLAGPL